MPAGSSIRWRSGSPRWPPNPGGQDGDLLNRLRDDLMRHVGAPLDDDAALLLARVTGAWAG